MRWLLYREIIIIPRFHWHTPKKLGYFFLDLFWSLGLLFTKSTQLLFQSTKQYVFSQTNINVQFRC